MRRTARCRSRMLLPRSRRCATGRCSWTAKSSRSTRNWSPASSSFSRARSRTSTWCSTVSIATGRTCAATPLPVRRAALEEAIGDTERLFPSRRLADNGLEAFKMAKKKGYEGVIAKDASAPYIEGRSTKWLKVKVHEEEEFIIVGFTPPAGSRTHFGALLLGAHRGKELLYVGKVGTGFTNRTLNDLHAKLRPLAVKTPPVVNPPREKGAVWIDAEARRADLLPRADGGPAPAPARVPGPARRQEHRRSLPPWRQDDESQVQGEITNHKSQITNPPPSLQSFQGLLARGGVHEIRPGALLRHGLSEAETARERPAAVARTLPGRNPGAVFRSEGEAAGHAGRHADEGGQAREGDDELRRRREARDAARPRQPRLHRGARLGIPGGRPAQARLGLFRPRSGLGRLRRRGQTPA